jgi:hypothetical protein
VKPEQAPPCPTLNIIPEPGGGVKIKCGLGESLKFNGNPLFPIRKGNPEAALKHLI